MTSHAVTPWRYTAGKLCPASAAAERLANTLAPGAVVSIEIRQDRNVKFHRFFFAMLQLTTDAINAGPLTSITVETLLKWVKIKLGYVKVIELPPHLAKHADQPHAVDYQSISFARMDQQAFYAFASEAARLIAAEFPWIVNSPQWDELRGMLAQLAGDEAA